MDSLKVFAASSPVSSYPSSSCIRYKRMHAPHSSMFVGIQLHPRVSNGIHTNDPSLYKQSTSCTTPKRTWFSLPCFVFSFPRVRTDQKWRNTVISSLELSSPHLPVLREFENAYELLWWGNVLISILQPFHTDQVRKPNPDVLHSLGPLAETFAAKTRLTRSAVLKPEISLRIPGVKNGVPLRNLFPNYRFLGEHNATLTEQTKH